MPPGPLPIPELEFLRKVKNFAELRSNLTALGMSSDLAQFQAYVHHIVECWFKLGEDHLNEARAAVTAGLARAAYSRAYYAAYSASKATRYMTKGQVSLKGDDHGAAPDLPDDFPNVTRCSAMITELYEYRLRADYDNWATTQSLNSLAPADAVAMAEYVVESCRNHLGAKHGIAL